MIRYVKKRDGRIVPFDKERITTAIFKAAKAVGGKDRALAERLANQVVQVLEERMSKEGEYIPTVEEIQDVVEKVLVENGHYKTAKAYILYRKQHQDLRQLKQLFSNTSIVENYINLNDWRVRENSNMTYSLQGLTHHIASVVEAE